MVVFFEKRFQFFEQKKVCWGQVGTVSELGNRGDAVFRQKVGHLGAGVTRCIAVLQFQFLAMAGRIRLTLLFSLLNMSR